MLPGQQVELYMHDLNIQPTYGVINIVINVVPLHAKVRLVIAMAMHGWSRATVNMLVWVSLRLATIKLLLSIERCLVTVYLSTVKVTKRWPP